MFARKCTYFQYKHPAQLAMVKDLYLTYFCLFSFSMLMNLSGRYLSGIILSEAYTFLK